MSDYSLTAPATITLTDTAGTVTIHVHAPDTPIEPPVEPPAGQQQQYVALAGSGDWIIRADDVRLDIDSGGTIYYGGDAIPDSSGSYAVGYDPSTNSTYKQAAPDAVWIYWGGNMTPSDWHTPSPPWTPPGSAPIPPEATGSPRDKLLTYLEQCSAPDRSLFGQTSFPDNREFHEVSNAYGFAPAIMFNDPWVVQWAGNAPYDGSFIGAQLEHCRTGGIAGMSLMLPNPANNSNSTDGAHVDPVQLLTPGTSLNNRLNSYLDQAAGLLQQHKDAGNAVLLRYLFELDGPWFWWGYGKFTHGQQTNLYRYITEYLRNTKHLDNLVTEFAINGGPGTYSYPGDDLVDVVGIDAYTNNLAGAYKSKYDTLRQQAPSKLFCMTEYGSGDPNGPDPNYDLTRLKADIQAALPRCCLVNFWSGWQPTKQHNGKAAMSDPFHLNKAQVDLP